MPNQDECRFRNTLEDLRECFDALKQGSAAGLDRDETRAKDMLVLTCADILAHYGYNIGVMDLEKTLLEDHPADEFS